MIDMFSFIYSRFYRWSKVIIWITSVILIGQSQTLGQTVIALAVALGYSIIPPLIDRVCGAKRRYSYNNPSRGKIEEYKETSPAMQYLSTLFEDISNINKLNSNFGIRFSRANINLHTPSLRLYLTPDEARTDFIPKLKNDLAAWYHCTGEKNPEKIQEEFISHLYNGRNRYIAKNVSFREELEDDSLEQFEHDSSGWSIRLKRFGGINSQPMIVTAITECAESNGFRVSSHNDDIEIYF